MFTKWFNKEDTTRVLEHPRDLAKSDMLTLKPRSELPESLQGATLTVQKVQAYQYSDGLVPEFVLHSPDGAVYTMMCEDEEEGDYITLARKIEDNEVENIFDPNELGELWGENFPVLRVNSAHNQFEGWLPDAYKQTVKEATAYFYNEDHRDSGVSSYVDDGSEELRFHECEGNDDLFSLNVEIWEDGSTEFFAQITIPTSFIDNMWPNA